MCPLQHGFRALGSFFFFFLNPNIFYKRFYSNRLWQTLQQLTGHYRGVTKINTECISLNGYTSIKVQHRVIQETQSKYNPPSPSCKPTPRHYQCTMTSSHFTKKSNNWRRREKPKKDKKTGKLLSSSQVFRLVIFNNFRKGGFWSFSFECWKNINVL